jgi:hypothetical protein
VGQGRPAVSRAEMGRLLPLTAFRPGRGTGRHGQADESARSPTPILFAV